MAIVVDERPIVIERLVPRGDTLTITIIKTNTPVSMSAWTWVAQVKASRSNTAAVLGTLTPDTSGASAGTVTFTWEADLDPGVYWYEIQRTLSSAKKTLMTGPLTVEADAAEAV